MKKNSKIPSPKDEIVKLYKVLSWDGYTRKNTTNAIWWVDREWKQPEELRGKKHLCTNTVLHAFRTEKQARSLFRWSTGGLGRAPILWEAEGVVVREDNNKVGCSFLRVTKFLGPLWGWHDELKKQLIW